MTPTGRTRMSTWCVATVIAALVAAVAMWLFMRGSDRTESERAAGNLPANGVPGTPPSRDDPDGTTPAGENLSVVSPTAPKPAVTQIHTTDPEWVELRAAAEAAGVNLVPVQQAKTVALRSATRRWDGARVGLTRLVCAPDGVPEAHFALVLKPGTPAISTNALAEAISALRKQRVELERRMASAGPDEVNELAAKVRSLWEKMRGADKYATVVVGANDGREPFIASFDGLPPQVFLRDDAIEMRRKQLGGADPGEPNVVWLPPLFVAFEFPPADGRGPGTYLQARGTELHEVDLHEWQRRPLSEELLQKRRAKWRQFEEKLDE